MKGICVAAALGSVCISDCVGINAYSLYIIGSIVLNSEVGSLYKIGSLFKGIGQILSIRKHCGRHGILSLSVKDQDLALLR